MLMIIYFYVYPIIMSKNTIKCKEKYTKLQNFRGPPPATSYFHHFHRVSDVLTQLRPLSDLTNCSHRISSDLTGQGQKSGPFLHFLNLELLFCEIFDRK